MTPSDAKSNTALLNALKHPLRRDILRELQTAPETSPRQIAATLGEPLSNVGYHCRVLRDCGAITLVRQAAVRGALQNFYRLSIEDPWVLEMLAQDSDDAPDLDP